jgi:hypothetical protein
MKFEQENFHSAIFTSYLADEQKFSARICQLRIFFKTRSQVSFVSFSVTLTGNQNGW